MKIEPKITPQGFSGLAPVMKKQFDAVSLWHVEIWSKTPAMIARAVIIVVMFSQSLGLATFYRLEKEQIPLKEGYERTKHWTHLIHQIQNVQWLSSSQLKCLPWMKFSPPIKEVPSHQYLLYVFPHDISCFFLLNLYVFPERGLPLNRSEQNMSLSMNSSPQWICPPQDQFPLQ